MARNSGKSATVLFMAASCSLVIVGNANSKEDPSIKELMLQNYRTIANVILLEADADAKLDRILDINSQFQKRINNTRLNFSVKPEDLSKFQLMIEQNMERAAKSAGTFGAILSGLQMRCFSAALLNNDTEVASAILTKFTGQLEDALENIPEVLLEVSYLYQDFSFRPSKRDTLGGIDNYDSFLSESCSSFLVTNDTTDRKFARPYQIWQTAQNELTVSGTIEPGFYEAFATAVDTATKEISSVTIASAGGNGIDDAMKAARLILKNEMNTKINGRCLSACTFLIAGGMLRSTAFSTNAAGRISGGGVTLGFHGLRPTGSRTTARDLPIGHPLYREVEKIFLDMGANGRVIVEFMGRGSADDLYFPPPEELCRTGLIGYTGNFFHKHMDDILAEKHCDDLFLYQLINVEEGANVLPSRR